MGKLKKSVAMILIMVLILSLTACSGSSNSGQNVSESTKNSATETSEDLIEIIIPNEFLDGSDEDDSEEEELEEETPEDKLNRLISNFSLDNENYCASVSYNEDGKAVLLMTQTQRDNLMQHNDELVERGWNEFLQADEGYSWEVSEDYRTLTIYCDENNFMSLFDGISTLAYLMLNSILYSGDENWSILVEFYNCHTGYLIKNWEASASSLGFEFGETDFVNSYMEEPADDEELFEVTLPDSWYPLASDSEEELVEKFTDDSGYYNSDVFLDDNNRVVLCLSETQRNNLIKYNVYTMTKVIENYLSDYSAYSYSISDDYTEATFYCDNTCDVMMIGDAMTCAALYESFNQILLGIEEWHVHISVCGVNSGKLYQEFTIPDDLETVNIYELNVDEWVD